MKHIATCAALLVCVSLAADPALAETIDPAQPTVIEAPAKTEVKPKSSKKVKAAPKEEVVVSSTQEEVVTQEVVVTPVEAPAPVESKPMAVQVPPKASQKAKPAAPAKEEIVNFAVQEEVVSQEVIVTPAEATIESAPVAAEAEQTPSSVVSKDASGGKSLNIKLPFFSRKDKKETDATLATTEVVPATDAVKAEEVSTETTASLPVQLQEETPVTTLPAQKTATSDSSMQESMPVNMDEMPATKQETACEKNPSKGLFANIAIATASAAVIVVSAILGSN